MLVCERMLTYGSYLLGVKTFNLQQLPNQAYEQYLGLSTILKNVKKPKKYASRTISKDIGGLVSANLYISFIGTI